MGWPFCRRPSPPADSRNPVPWDQGPTAAMRGQPAALAAWQRRPRGPQTAAMPAAPPPYLHHRGYDRGAAAFSPVFGLLSYNPIGAGVPSVARLPTIAGPGARYQFGAIWFAPQTIPTSIRGNPTVPVQTVAALLQQTRVSATYRTTG